MARARLLGHDARHAQHARSQGRGPARSVARDRHDSGRSDARAHRAAGARSRSPAPHLEAKQKLIERKDRDIAWRDAKLEKINFELARLKRWKFGAKSEAMNSEQRQMFQDTLLEDEADLEACMNCRLARPPPNRRPTRRRSTAICPHTCRVKTRCTAPRPRPPTTTRAASSAAACLRRALA
jgi:hypothetical protein